MNVVSTETGMDHESRVKRLGTQHLIPRDDRWQDWNETACIRSKALLTSTIAKYTLAHGPNQTKLRSFNFFLLYAQPE